MMAKWLIVHTVGGDTPTIVEWTGLNVFQWQRCMLASPCSTLCVLSYFFFFRWGIAFPMRPPLTWMILSWKTLEQPGPSLSIPFKKKERQKKKHGIQSHDGSVCMPWSWCHLPSTKTPVMLSHRSTMNLRIRHGNGCPGVPKLAERYQEANGASMGVSWVKVVPQFVNER